MHFYINTHQLNSMHAKTTQELKLSLNEINTEKSKLSNRAMPVEEPINA